MRGEGVEKEEGYLYSTVFVVVLANLEQKIIF